MATDYRAELIKRLRKIPADARADCSDGIVPFVSCLVQQGCEAFSEVISHFAPGDQIVLKFPEFCKKTVSYAFNYLQYGDMHYVEYIFDRIEIYKFADKYQLTDIMKCMLESIDNVAKTPKFCAFVYVNTDYPTLKETRQLAYNTAKKVIRMGPCVKCDTCDYRAQEIRCTCNRSKSIKVSTFIKESTSHCSCCKKLYIDSINVTHVKSGSCDICPGKLSVGYNTLRTENVADGAVAGLLMRIATDGEI